ncbi:hypothetical protein ABIE21_000265 [Conyzicola nivalis]|uniref:Uncharacterized protein n=1 Tax=Conyzicola nivalis TaxID=1477021 RepID=A0ABV2QIA1_9MICO
MAAAHPELRTSFTDRALIDDSAAGSTTIGLGGLLARRGHRARRARVPGSAAVRGFRWRLVDVFSQTWWPQGVAVGEHDGGPVVITSWFAQRRRGRDMGSRISVIDLRDERRPRYHHVLLVSPRRGGYDPVVVHAGGIVIAGDRLLVSATLGGIREFRLGDLVRAPSRGLLRRSAGPFGYRYLLPEFASHRPPKDADAGRMRYSFIAAETSTREEHEAEVLRIVAGEYAKHDRRRLARLSVRGDVTTIDETHVPGIAEMQGVAVHDGRWFVNASRGDKLGADLWVGTPDAMVRHEGVLPPGPEDLAVWPERGELWSVTEFPGKRWIYAVDLARFGEERA